ncbi:hypothetical protein PFICI_04766 [Pestalotiopsis fici W106-1]|uniref:Transcription factor domain-containing protein n=1 Tax=Pestalotiopsis fici (strain W106-1 / CGMCC3.15140) TaxID=1229662 RepID=W3XA03_PESFW|nr:uncharacterized protein PFICI_04766 [Pestalotiopsis fici W106-1]ETS82890.1 hypothetical protein PFICI_04766 [Pestalotiopsis fici W106-1]
MQGTIPSGHVVSSFSSSKLRAAVDCDAHLAAAATAAATAATLLAIGIFTHSHWGETAAHLAVSRDPRAGALHFDIGTRRFQVIAQSNQRTGANQPWHLHHQWQNPPRGLTSSATTKPAMSVADLESKNCTYVGSSGETRIEATKNRLELLEKVLGTLQNGSSDQAAQLLSDLRSTTDLTSALGRIAVDGPSQSSTPSHNTTDSAHSPDGTISPGFSQTANRSSVSTPMHTTSYATSEGRISPVARSGPSSFVFPGTCAITPPRAEEVSLAVSGFFRCSGALFHVFSEDQARKIYDAVYGEPEAQMNASAADICCLMTIAAVGAQYEHGNYDLQTETAFYDIAKHYFDDIVNQEGLDAIKVCILLSMYNVFEKSTVALAYIEVGLSLSRQYQMVLEQRKRPDSQPGALSESKHIWRTLVFLSSWLSSTLGYVSGNDMMVNGHLPVGFTSDSDNVIEIVQAEMTNIAVLKAKILRMHLAFKDLTVLSVKSILVDLQTWYGRLPAQIRLDYDERDSLTPLTKWSIYHVHLLYLGANIILYRRMSSQLIETRHSGIGQGVLQSPLEKLYSDHGGQAVLAAKSSAHMLFSMLQETGIFRRCWLIIFQSYTSCLIILHSATQKMLHSWRPSSWQDDLAKADLCLEVLKYCASADPTAQRFYSELKEFRDYIAGQTNSASPDGSYTLSQPHLASSQSNISHLLAAEDETQDSSYLIRMPSNARPDHLDVSCRLLIKLCQPYGDPEHQGAGIEDVKQRWRDEPTRALHSLMMARLDWDLESRQSFQWDSRKLANITSNPTSGFGAPVVSRAGDTLSIIQQVAPRRGNLEGQFLGSMQPSGWKMPHSAVHVASDLPKNPRATGPQVTIEEMVID